MLLKQKSKDNILAFKAKKGYFKVLSWRFGCREGVLDK